MRKELSAISPNKKEFKTDKMKVPVVFHASDELLPNEETFSQLENLAKDDRLFHHIAAMSDVHPKPGRKNPTGTAVASKNFLFPQINDTAPNCGMRFIKTDLDENTSPEKIDELFQELVKAIPTKKYVGTKIPYDLAIDIGQKGIAPLKEHFKTRIQNEIENTSHNGNFSDPETTRREILDVIPKFFFKIGRYRLGILGAAGNHFLDLMKITEIKDTVTAEKLGVKEGQYIFMIHTGSGLLGQYASYMYTPKTKEHLSQKIMLKIGTTFFGSQMKPVYNHLSGKIKDYQNKDEFFGYDDQSLEGRMFIRAHKAVANFGFANRAVITHNLDQTLEKVFGKQINLDLLYDISHISINKEKHFNEDVWVHRNGAVRAYGPKMMSDHPVFSSTGEPVFIPSSMSTPAYIGVGTDQNTSSFFSAGHGTGRKRDAGKDVPRNKKELRERVEKSNVKLYNAKSKGVILQDSGYYKDIEEVISGMEANKIIKSVAKMQPVAVLMY
ncbi:RNA-splicing ligase RtcB [bacterium BMS3Abin15]|nr:RNA-splicing ligase RtcB [bacterium BMS3Abin15]HDZ85194.1 RtcB family protein [Candidatus Moranbacteria bacterium]